MSHDDHEPEHTIVELPRPGARPGRAAAVAPAPPPAARPRKLPAFVPAETVVPTVSYRGATSAAASGAAAAAAIASLPAFDAEPSVVAVVPQPPRPRPRLADATPVPAPVPAPAAQPRGELTVVFGCRGGAGATTLAINVAAQLVRARRTACVVDLDLQLGDVFVALDLPPETSLAAVAREAGALDAVALRRRLGQHASGVCALTQVGHLDDLDPQLPAHLPALFDTLRTHFDHVIVDGVRDFGDAALAALDAATRIIVVVTQDVASVRRAARVITLLRRLQVPDARIQLVVNRAERGAAVDDAAIERALGLRLAARVREDARAAEALDAGALLLDLARSRPIAGDVARVAELLRGERDLATAPGPARGGLLGLFGRKGGK